MFEAMYILFFLHSDIQQTHRSFNSTSCNCDFLSDVSDISVDGNSRSFNLFGLLIRKMHGSQCKNTTRTYLLLYKHHDYT